MIPFVLKKDISLSAPGDNGLRAFDQRIRAALNMEPFRIPLSVLRRIPIQSAGKGTAKFPGIIARDGNGYKMVDVAKERSYSLALDIGTTNLVASLYDNIGRRIILDMSLENPQVEVGNDILTRMHNAMSQPVSGEVYQLLIAGINRLIGQLCLGAGIDRDDIHAMSVAGNTIMTHFFLRLDISTIPVAPYAPMVGNPGFFSASQLSVDINPEAVVYVFPSAGSYVGGDTIAGILASGIYLSNVPYALIDVGTNVEVVIGNKDWMLVGAGAAGPALEEGISMIGKRAKRGIIYDVEIGNGGITCKTFDNGTPEGICGSGMVSLLSELYRTGLIDRSGTLVTGRDHIAVIDNEQAFRISCGGSDALHLKQSEIRNFIKSKAALFTLLLVLVRSLGLRFGDIEKIFVAGALGTGINAEKAIALGMLPEWPMERIKPMGNTSLEGAQMILEDGGLVENVDVIANMISYKDLHDDPEFMREFMGAVFIPHTNTDLLKM